MQLLPLYLKIKRPRVIRKFNDYKALFQKDYSCIAKYQEKELIDILKYAKENVSYYNSLLSQYKYIDYDEIDFNGFRRIPYLTKKDIRIYFDQLKSKEELRCYRNTSGGTTGEPVVFLQDSIYSEDSYAAELYHYFMNGILLSDPILKLWGSERDIIENTRSLKQKMMMRIYNTELLNSFRMGDKEMKQYVERINEVKPKVILAYVQSIYELAKYIREHELEITPPSVLMTSAGVLEKGIKDFLSQVLGCPVVNRYGSRETGDMACSCTQSDYLHISMQTHFLEIIDKQGNPVPDGTEGEIAVTLLINRVMPLIRYKIGDRGVMLHNYHCKCGLRTDVLTKVIGRTVDIFLNRKGERIDGEYFTHLFYFRNWIRKFQVIQKTLDQFEVLIEPAQQITARQQLEIEEIKKNMLLVTGRDVGIIFRFVEQIPPDPSGKFRFTRSEVR